jgi:hypothetical protein
MATCEVWVGGEAEATQTRVYLWYHMVHAWVGQKLLKNYIFESFSMSQR